MISNTLYRDNKNILYIQRIHNVQPTYFLSIRFKPVYLLLCKYAYLNIINVFM